MLKNSDHTQEKCTFVLVQLLLFDNAIVLYMYANRKAPTRKAHWCIIKHHASICSVVPLRPISLGVP